MIKVLHELASLDGGGVARLLYDYYRNMDHSKVHFDFLIYDYYKEGILERPLQDMGCHIFKVPRMEAGKQVFLEQMKKVFQQEKYDIIHSHRGPQGYYALSCAKKNGIPIRIAHSHLAYKTDSIERRIKDGILIRLDMRLATDLFACGRDAAIGMWGKKNYRRKKVHIMTNAIDIDKFSFSLDMRKKKRQELGLDNKYTIGIVGRLEEQKNYPFLIEMLAKIIKNRNDVKLLIVGRGSKENEIRELCKKHNVDEYVCFLGVRNDVHELLNAFDLFVLPSLFEGLPVVLVEAQANGVKELVADTITNEMAVTDLIEFLPTNNIDKWVNKILDNMEPLSDRRKYSDVVANNGYGIKQQAHFLEEYYLDRVKN